MHDRVSVVRFVTLGFLNLLTVLLILCSSTSNRAGSQQQPHPGVKNIPGYQALLYGTGVFGPTVSGDDWQTHLQYQQAILQELQSLRAEIRVINGKATVGPSPSTEITPAERLSVAKAECAMCHTPSVADVKGKGYILFATDEATAFKPVNAKQRQAESALVRGKVERGEMPPNKKLTPDKVRALSEIWR